MEADGLCAQTNSARADVSNRRYCAFLQLSAALGTRLSDLNTVSGSSRLSRSERSSGGAAASRRERTRVGLDVRVPAPRRATGADSAPRLLLVLRVCVDGGVRGSMLGDKAPKCRGSSFYIDNLLGPAATGDAHSPEVCGGRQETTCKSPPATFPSHLELPFSPALVSFYFKSVPPLSHSLSIRSVRKHAAFF